MTREDLAQIGKVIDQKLEPIKSDVAGIKSNVAGIKQEQEKQGRTLNRVQKDIKLILKYHDENVIRLRERIECLEEYTGINKN